MPSTQRPNETPVSALSITMLTISPSYQHLLPPPYSLFQIGEFGEIGPKTPLTGIAKLAEWWYTVTMLTKSTALTTGTSIRAYLDREYIRHTRLVNALGITRNQLSRMLNDKGRHAGERLTVRLVEAIADELDVPAAIRREWLSLLSDTPTQAA